MWHLRGSLSRSEAWALSPIERKEMAEYIEERIEIVKETKLPLI